MSELLQAARQIEAQIIEDRRTIHRRPEVGFELTETAAYVQKRLADMGIESQICGGPLPLEAQYGFAAAGFPVMRNFIGVTATIGSGEPCILLRADMDALPMMEAEGHVDFASERPGAAHMCGHDSHTAMLLGAAKLLKEREDELCGTVKLMFQPGEECGCGAMLMIQAGLLENPKVDAALAIHVKSQQPVGTVEYTVGCASAAMDSFLIQVKGKGGHSSAPQNTVDPLMIVNQLYTTLNLLVGRETDPRETVALTVGKCGGGVTDNVIPDSAEMMVGVRTFNNDVRNHLLKRIPEVTEHTVKMWRGEYEILSLGAPSTFTDEALCGELADYAGEIVGMENVSCVPCKTGTEDFAYVTQCVPGMLLNLGAGDETHAPLHSPDMVLDESAFAIGAAVYANCAVEWLKKHQK